MDSFAGKHVGRTANRSRRGGQAGFSLVELGTAVTIAIVIMAISMIELQPFWQQLQANSAMQQVKEVMRIARETAISERRTVVVQFSSNNTISLYKVAEPSNVESSTAFTSTALPGTSQFMTFAAEIDTPDAFGIPSSPGGIEFGGSSGTPTSGIEFQSDGTFTNGNGVPINGTLFIGLPKVPVSARAVTVMGATGRIKPYHYSGTAWLQ